MTEDPKEISASEIECFKLESLLLRRNKEVLSLNKELREAERNLKNLRRDTEKEIAYLRSVIDFSDGILRNIADKDQSVLFSSASNVYAEIKTEFLDNYANSLNWGDDAQRRQKMTTIREIRAWAKAEIEKHKIASYQLQYLLALYPALQDVLDTDYCDLRVERDKIPEYDYTRDYLSKEEWAQLSESERNQLALDRYIESHNKTKWQIGRDYEMYIGYTYEQNGWTVQYTGIEMGFEDLGRDLIAQKDGKIEIVQCKYWSESKTIHEKHVMQLYGTVIAYQIQNPKVPPERINAVFITNIQLSDTARKFADVLDVHVREHVPKGDYPRIKCNIGKDEYGDKTYIYHLPMDLNYDSVKLDKPGECKVFTVKEAEDKGFRRAFKWHSTE